MQLPAAVSLCACARLKKAAFVLFLLCSLPFSKLLLLQGILGLLLVYRSVISRVTRAEPLSSITSMHGHLPSSPHPCP